MCSDTEARPNEGIPLPASDPDELAAWEASLAALKATEKERRWAVIFSEIPEDVAQRIALALKQGQS